MVVLPGGDDEGWIAVTAVKGEIWIAGAKKGQDFQNADWLHSFSKSSANSLGNTINKLASLLPEPVKGPKGKQ